MPETHRIYNPTISIVTPYSANVHYWFNDAIKWPDWLAVALNEIVMSHYEDTSLGQSRFALASANPDMV